jgi:hypothetical protein
MEVQMEKTWIIVIVVTLALVLASCNFPFTASSDSTLSTEVAQTVQALESEVKQPTLAIPTMMPTLALPTIAPVATMTPVPTATTEPCLFAALVSETIPDNTKFSPGESFTKSWTLKNTGACDWNTDYRLAFKSGDQMGAPDSVKITEETRFGDTIKIKVDMVAPSSKDTYKGIWQLETNKGVKFGQVWVQIKVE